MVDLNALEYLADKVMFTHQLDDANPYTQGNAILSIPLPYPSQVMFTHPPQVIFTNVYPSTPGNIHLSTPSNAYLFTQGNIYLST